MGKVTFLSIEQTNQHLYPTGNNVYKKNTTPTTYGLHHTTRKTSGTALRGTYQKSDIPAPGSPRQLRWPYEVANPHMQPAYPSILIHFRWEPKVNQN